MRRRIKYYILVAIGLHHKQAATSKVCNRNSGLSFCVVFDDCQVARMLPNVSFLKIWTVSSSSLNMHISITSQRNTYYDFCSRVVQYNFEICVLLRLYAALQASSSPSLLDAWRFDRQSRNVRNELPFYAALNTRRGQISFIPRRKPAVTQSTIFPYSLETVSKLSHPYSHTNLLS